MLSQRFYRLCQRDQRLRLDERLPSGKGNASKERIPSDLRQDSLRIGLTPALRVVGLGIMTPRTVVGTPLGKDHIPDPGAVHDGILLDPGDPQRLMRDCV